MLLFSFARISMHRIRAFSIDCRYVSPVVSSMSEHEDDPSGESSNIHVVKAAARKSNM